MDAITLVVGLGVAAVLICMGYYRVALNQEEMELLVCGILMGVLAPWGWPVSYYFYLCLICRETLVLYNMAKSTLYFIKQGARANPLLKICFECD